MQAREQASRAVELLEDIPELGLRCGAVGVVCSTWFEPTPAYEVEFSRVVSMPSWDIFEKQPREYRDGVLPVRVKARVAIEQASTFGWERYVGDAGRVIGMKTFGASAPLKELQKKFGFEPDRVVATAMELLVTQTK